jgi:DNA transformation protein
VQARRVNDNASLNLLWALESALTGEPWQHVAKRHRASLLLAVDDLERSAR